jgi:hypothetical protein
MDFKSMLEELKKTDFSDFSNREKNKLFKEIDKFENFIKLFSNYQGLTIKKKHKIFIIKI